MFEQDLYLANFYVQITLLECFVKLGDFLGEDEKASADWVCFLYADHCKVHFQEHKIILLPSVSEKCEDISSEFYFILGN